MNDRRNAANPTQPPVNCSKIYRILRRDIVHCLIPPARRYRKKKSVSTRLTTFRVSTGARGAFYKAGGKWVDSDPPSARW